MYPYNKMTDVDVDVDNEVIEFESEPEIEDMLETKNEVTLGNVINCDRLNLRKEPNSKAKILQTIKKGAEVMIEMEESTDEFYKVVLASGYEGFCMRDYIEVQK